MAGAVLGARRYRNRLDPPAQLVPEAKTGLKNRAHPDLTVADVERAVAEVMALGGALIKPPGPFPETDPELEWAVMADPFGNEFCLIRDLEPSG